MSRYFGFNPDKPPKNHTAIDKHIAKKWLVEVEHHGVISSKEVALIEKAIESDECKVKFEEMPLKNNGKRLRFTITIEKDWGG